MINRVIWEGWTIQDFINELAPQVKIIMSNQSWQKPFASKNELKSWCKENQPYYKKHIKEVVDHFAKMYKIKG